MVRVEKRGKKMARGEEKNSKWIEKNIDIAR